MANQDDAPRLYKVLGEDGQPFHGGAGKWYLPRGKRPGQWMPKIKGPLDPCRNGYHLCRPQDLPRWLGPIIYESETRGESIVHENSKVVVREARLLRKVEAWNDTNARLLAAACAASVLHIYERDYPHDDRPRKAIIAGVDFTHGRISAASRDAAWAAVRDVVRDAAWAAVRDAAGQMLMALFDDPDAFEETYLTSVLAVGITAGVGVVPETRLRGRT